MIHVGDTVQDSITKVRGIVMVESEWLYGCRRIGIQPLKLKDGAPRDVEWYDEPRLLVLKTKRSKNILSGGGPSRERNVLRKDG